ncbi:MAG TPA: DUF4126 domain-containing protein [Chloroflexia bacterium]|nr:DUF4126 domain-containing protein [Chloroflexia bacterium]
MDTLIQILAGLGLAASAGLNAWLPLLIVGLAARFTTLIHLSAPYNLLSNGWVLATLSVLLLIEILADKVPVVDSLNDAIHTFIRPAAGAILFAAHNNALGDLNPVLALILGLLAAGSVHAVKASVRPVLTATTGGLANPIVSVIEDAVAIVSTLLALLVPALSAVLFLIFLIVAVRLLFRWRQRHAARADLQRAR